LALGLAALVSGCGSGASQQNQSLSSYVRAQSPSAHTVRFQLDAGLGSANGGFNFDGRSDGNLVYIVPLGWRVTMVVHNSGTFPHSAVVSNRSTSVSPVFDGASTPNPLVGMRAGSTQTITFTAGRAGRYTIVCAVPGHAPEGMWIRFVVSRTASRASVSN
ncbi:sulfocyanin, partial [mine drainage metagenome]